MRASTAGYFSQRTLAPVSAILLSCENPQEGCSGDFRGASTQRGSFIFNLVAIYFHRAATRAASCRLCSRPRFAAIPRREGSSALPPTEARAAFIALSGVITSICTSLALQTLYLLVQAFHYCKWRYIRLEHQYFVEAGCQIQICHRVAPAIDIATLLDCSWRPHIGYRAACHHRIDELNARFTVENGSLAAERVNSHDF